MINQKTETLTVPCYNVIDEDILSEEFFTRAQVLMEKNGNNTDLLMAIAGGLTIAIAKLLVVYTGNPLEVSQTVVSDILNKRIEFYVKNMRFNNKVSKPNKMEYTK